MSPEYTAARRLARFREQSVIGRCVNCNAQLVEQECNRSYLGDGTILHADVSNGLSLSDHSPPKAIRAAVNRDQRGEQHVTYCRLLRLQAGQSDFNSIRHGGSLSLLPDLKPIRAELLAHRLSESSK